MDTTEKIILGVGFFLLLGILIYPPVKMKGHSEIAEQWKKLKRLNELEHQRYGYEAPFQMIIPTENHGESDSPYINWSKETRRVVFLDFKFDEDIKYLVLSENDKKGSEDSGFKANRIDGKKDKEKEKAINGTIEWQSEINMGRLIIEILMTILISGAAFLFVRFK